MHELVPTNTCAIKWEPLCWMLRSVLTWCVEQSADYASILCYAKLDTHLKKSARSLTQRLPVLPVTKLGDSLLEHYERSNAIMAFSFGIGGRLAVICNSHPASAMTVYCLFFTQGHIMYTFVAK
ncbi:hypothetical protein TRVL_09436 [Trypanosoma vivax]|nr:hypothetical protein TRVL_09436 [Trypanosoma vivax]